VALFHTGLGRMGQGSPLVVRFLHSGYTGVTFFFVLSGFILAYNYPTIPSAKSFWIARFARVYPVYVLSIVLAVLMHGMHGLQQPVLSLVMTVGLLQAWWLPLFQVINPAAWTLSVEAFFYAVLPFVLPWMRRLTWRTFAALQAGYLVVVISPLLLNAAHRPDAAQAVAGYLESSVPLFRLNPFLVGVFLGLQWNALFVTGRISPLRTRRRLWAGLGIVGSLALLETAPGVLFTPLRTALLSYTFALVIVGLAESRLRLLTSHGAQVAGEISYGFYILQFPVLAICGDIQSRTVPGMNFSDDLWVYLPVLTLAAWVSFRWFEIPARLWLRRLLTGRPVAVREI
jgi:peptidoglycan/LPS O-acetylase OafA/YrhL